MGSAEQLTILIVEDEDAIRLTLRDYLERRGFRVLVASDGVGAIKQMLDNSVDVMVTDYRMDVFGGDYWIRFLQVFGGPTKVVVTSGFLNNEHSIPFPVLNKPYSYSDLEEFIRTLTAT